MTSVAHWRRSRPSVNRLRSPRALGATVATCAALSCAALPCATGALAAARPEATAARTVQFTEVGRLKFHNERGATLIEYGQAKGTYDAPLMAEFTLHEKRATARVTIYPQGGSITGVANAEYKIEGSYYYFGGQFTLDHGTGKFRKVSDLGGKTLGISGIFDHRTLELVEVKTKGAATY